MGEASARPAAVASLQKNVESYKKWLADAQANEAFSHITEEEFSTCHKKCDEVSSWLYEMLDKQGSLAQNVDPAFYASEVNDKSKGMSNVCNPIVHKPKPKPKPEPKKEEAKPEDVQLQMQKLQRNLFLWKLRNQRKTRWKLTRHKHQRVSHELRIFHETLLHNERIVV